MENEKVMNEIINGQIKEIVQAVNEVKKKEKNMRNLYLKK